MSEVRFLTFRFKYSTRLLVAGQPCFLSASTIDLKVLEHELQMEQCGGTNILLEARKKYPPRTRNEVRFQDFLQNQVYVKR